MPPPEDPEESMRVFLARIDERQKTLFKQILLLQTQTTGVEARLTSAMARVEEIADQVQGMLYRQEGEQGSIARLAEHERRIRELEQYPQKAKWTADLGGFAVKALIFAATLAGAVVAVLQFI